MQERHTLVVKGLQQDDSGRLPVMTPDTAHTGSVEGANFALWSNSIANPVGYSGRSQFRFLKRGLPQFGFSFEDSPINRVSAGKSF